MFFERADAGEKAVVVHLDLHLNSDDDLDEFLDLASSANVEVVSVLRGSRSAPDAGFFIGKGKLQELSSLVSMHQADVVLFNHALSPSQERNLEAEVKARVIDRTGVILDIFAQRARTHEGKLQVELAQLQHVATRLIRGWTHLERQKGGIGLRGPGETQLETDRRLLRARIKTIQSRLQKVQKQRAQGRRSRQRADIPTLSIVGYTNAGKSSLFNALTTSEVYAADQLFATLDPTLRRLELDDVGAVVLADTVGFIKQLPHKLVDAFKATLEETVEADLLLHVVDCAAEERDTHMLEVDQVLKEIHAEQKSQLLVFNKIDILGIEPRIDYVDQVPARVWVSAKDNRGLSLLKQAIIEHMSPAIWQGDIVLPADMAGTVYQLQAALFAANAIRDESYDEHGNLCLSLRIAEAERKRLIKQFSLNWSELSGQQEAEKEPWE
ncbi:MAG: GTPase HflX [Pseudomonadales bacterium]|nr:GTPase HflX [Pseudomonadales bacterium]